MSRENLSTREKILIAAWELLEAAQGKGVRMSDIAKRAGISRQAVYLHFETRADLLIATTLYLDEVKDVDGRLSASRTAKTGVERLDAYIEAWGNYIPEIYGIGRALMSMQDADEEAAAAWNNRMQAMREGCEAAVRALDRDSLLATRYSVAKATDLLWTLLSVRNWEHLTIDCGWPQNDYVDAIKRTARQALVRLG